MSSQLKGLKVERNMFTVAVKGNNCISKAPLDKERRNELGKKAK